jgi:predicted O-methyltransferase YrrM
LVGTTPNNRTRYRLAFASPQLDKVLSRLLAAASREEEDANAGPALAGPIDLVLLDRWKDLCVPVPRALEPKLAPGALVAADDITHASMAGYLDYVRDPANGYVTVAFPVEDGMELSSWTTAGPSQAAAPGGSESGR